jgi:hypothetical protein
LRGLTDSEAALLRDGLVRTPFAESDLVDDFCGKYEPLRARGVVAIETIALDDEWETVEACTTPLGRLALQLYDAGIR